jgi:SAM-dependent methyltransferase
VYVVGPASDIPFLAAACGLIGEARPVAYNAFDPVESEIIEKALMGDFLDRIIPQGPMYQSRVEWEGFYQEADPWGYVGRWLMERKRQEIMSRLFRERGPFQRALDLGSGEGVVTRFLVDHCRSLVSVEISERALRRQKDRLSADGRLFIHADAFRAAFRPGSFDLVCASEVLAYSSSRELVLEEWVRWLRPAGFFFFVDGLLPGYFRFEEVVRLLEARLQIVHVEPLSSKHLLAKLANRKLLPFYERIYDRTMVWTRRDPARLAKQICIICRKPA